MANRSSAFAVTLSESARRKPSGIPSATALAGREASVSSSFPSRLTLDGFRPLSARKLWPCPHPLVSGWIKRDGFMTTRALKSKAGDVGRIARSHGVSRVRVCLVLMLPVWRSGLAMWIC